MRSVASPPRLEIPTTAKEARIVAGAPSGIPPSVKSSSSVFEHEQPALRADRQQRPQNGLATRRRRIVGRTAAVLADPGNDPRQRG